LDNFEALQSQAIYGLYRNDLRICMNEKSLNFDPFFLFFSKVKSTLSFLNFLIEFVYNNRNEQVHDEECCQEDEHDED